MEEIKKDFEEKKKELKDWLYGTVYKGYDLEELAETVQQNVDDFFTEEWLNSVIDLAVSKERSRIKDKLETMQLEGLSFSEVQKDAYNTAIRDVLRFINLINTK